jgi:hypothetical protein
MHTFSTERSISELFGSALGEFSKLIQSEFQIARLEVSDKIAAMLGAAKFLGAGVAIALAALVIILMAVAAVLMRLGMPTDLAYLCTGVGAAIIAFALIQVGLSRIKDGYLTPSATLHELRQDQIVAKGLLQ